MVITKKMQRDVNKIVYLAHAYPEHTIVKLIQLLAMPALDINVAVWLAIQQGFLGEINKESGEFPRLQKAPEEFGPEQEELEHRIIYAFHQIAKEEADLEEQTVTGPMGWLSGYPMHDITISMRRLLDSNQLAEYQIEDGENKYIFYTLAANKDKQWGRKQFKTDPLEKPKKK